MPTMRKLREDLDLVLDAVSSLRQGCAKGETAFHAQFDKAFGMQIEEVSSLVRQLRDDADTSLGKHPASAIAAALTLGFTIGRLTSK